MKRGQKGCEERAEGVWRERRRGVKRAQKGCGENTQTLRREKWTDGKVGKEWEIQYNGGMLFSSLQPSFHTHRYTSPTFCVICRS